MNEHTFDAQDIGKHKIIAAAAYLWVLFLIPLFFAMKSPFAQACAKQGLVLFIAQAVSSLFLWIPVLGPIWGVIIFFIVPLYAITRTLTGSYWAIPIIHGYASRVSFD